MSQIYKYTNMPITHLEHNSTAKVGSSVNAFKVDDGSYSLSVWLIAVASVGSRVIFKTFLTFQSTYRRHGASWDLSVRIG
jgi:hypothetical protein